MRTTLIALALVLVACGRSERAGTPAVSDAPSGNTVRGPDELALRFPQGGGVVRAVAYPALDSVVWSSSDKAPTVERFLGFDDEAGSVAAVDAKGALVRVDLRSGAVSRDAKPALTDLASSDGSTVYGIAKGGSIVRLTPSGSWTFEPPLPARDIFPEPNGALLVLADGGGHTTIWQMYPPDRALTDTITFPRLARALHTQVGDRVYFALDSTIIGVRNRGLEREPRIPLGHEARALVATPSGDRLYVATESSDEVLVIDRYTHAIEAHIRVPGGASELRMDPLGRYVLARAIGGDSAWVLAVATNHAIGAVATEWRHDLPAVTPDGSIALVKGRDVVLVDGATLRQKHVVKKGARDSWLFITWNGFRPSSSQLGQPMTAADSDTSARAVGGSTSAAPPLAGDSGAPRTPPRDSAGRVAAPPSTPTPSPAPATRDSAALSHRAPPPAPAPVTTGAPAGGGVAGGSIAAPAGQRGFTVQFAAVRSEPTAKGVASTIIVGGKPARVVATVRAGITIYRVVLGPYATRAEAERIARESGKAYWIYEGAP